MFDLAQWLKAGMYLKYLRKTPLLANGRMFFWVSKFNVNIDKKYELKRLFSLLD
jgi:hypothetical protein